MRSVPRWGAALLCVAIASSGVAAERENVPESVTHFEDSIRPVLVQFCGDCHDPADKDNHVAFLKATNLDGVAAERGLWKSVAEQLRNRTMPPADETQPPEEERLRVATWVDAALRATACREGEYAGAIMPRRLNRFEYDNTIRDLVGVETHASDAFPVDGSGGEGFDNNAETLFLPPLLMERYLEAAADILDAGVVSPPLELTFGPGDLLPSPEGRGAADEPREIGPKQEVTALVTVYVTGDCTVRVQARAEEATQLALRLDGIVAGRYALDSGEDDAKPNENETPVRLTRGTHAIAVRCVGDSPAQVVRLELRENREAAKAEKIAIHERLFGTPPGHHPDDPRTAAHDVLSRFARRAFRRPLREGEVERLMVLYDRAAERGDPYEEAVKLALKGVLVSPSFLFRVEDDPHGAKPELIGDHDLAVRLSYFLWSSLPDDELMRLADEGRLQDPAVLAAQVDRMLDDERSRAFAQQFIGQWLGTHEVGARVAPDTSVFKGEFTTELILDLRDEPVYLFQYLLAENRSLLELLDADYAIVNDRLAQHYGFVKEDQPEERSEGRGSRRDAGGKFRRMDLPDDHRGGVLGMGSVHMLTSYPDRTSPVLRGGWVLETLLGVRVPSPPPDVPQLKRDKKSKVSVREQLAEHRANPTCAACHNLMDPLGFALDNFDVLGRWRDKDGEAEVDASATLPSGEEFEGPAGLRRVLLDRKDQFLHHLTAKMLGYALGRSLEDGDDCTVNRIADKVSESGDATRVLIREIVLSTPFRSRQAGGGTDQKHQPSQAADFKKPRAKDPGEKR